MTLGKGVRVFVGWSRPDKLTANAVGCVTGTILVGPFPAGAIRDWPNEITRFIAPEVVRIGHTTEPSWLVAIDTGPVRHQACVESVLFPIEGNDPAEVEQEEAVTA